MRWNAVKVLLKVLTGVECGGGITPVAEYYTDLFCYLLRRLGSSFNHLASSWHNSTNLIPETGPGGLSCLSYHSAIAKLSTSASNPRAAATAANTPSLACAAQAEKTPATGDPISISSPNIKLCTRTASSEISVQSHRPKLIKCAYRSSHVSLSLFSHSSRFLSVSSLTGIHFKILWMEEDSFNFGYNDSLANHLGKT